MRTWDLWTDWLIVVIHRAANVLNDCFSLFWSTMCVGGASMMALLHEFVCWMNCRYHSYLTGAREGEGVAGQSKQLGGTLTGRIRCM